MAERIALDRKLTHRWWYWAAVIALAVALLLALALENTGVRMPGPAVNDEPSPQSMDLTYDLTRHGQPHGGPGGPGGGQQGPPPPCPPGAERPQPHPPRGKPACVPRQAS